MRRLVPIALGFSAGVFISFPALAAATVEVVKGQVSVNQGQGYKQVAAGSAVSTGDRVMAAPGGRGRIVYANGCAVDVHPGAVVTVPEKCYEPMRAGLEAPVAEAAHPYYGAWIPYVGAAAVVGVGACAVAGCFNDNDPGNGNGRPHGRTHDGGDNNN
jgi:hypothetical protein